MAADEDMVKKSELLSKIINKYGGPEGTPFTLYASEENPIYKQLQDLTEANADKVYVIVGNLGGDGPGNREPRATTIQAYKIDPEKLKEAKDLLTYSERNTD